MEIEFIVFVALLCAAAHFFNLYSEAKAKNKRNVTASEAIRRSKPNRKLTVASNNPENIAFLVERCVHSENYVLHAENPHYVFYGDYGHEIDAPPPNSEGGWEVQVNLLSDSQKKSITGLRSGEYP